MTSMNSGSPLPLRDPGSKKWYELKPSIGTKIILPYLMLTLIVAGIGTFVISNLVASSLQERFNNQLLDAGRRVAESTVQYEANRLQILRAVAGTFGVPEALNDADAAALARLVPQIIANSDSHVVKLLNMAGIEVYGWQQLPNVETAVPAESAGEDLSNISEVQRVLAGEIDEFGDKRVVLHETDGELVLYTIGPVFLNGEQVGVVMIGDEVRQMVEDLTIASVARVTIYDKNGQVLDTTLGGAEDPVTITGLADLNETPEKYQEVIANASKQTQLRDVSFLERDVSLLEQDYLLAYGDWRLREQSFGMFSVALSSNFIISALATSRNQFSLIFAGATIAVLAVGFLTAQRIVKPVDRLVETALAVTAGDLDRRSGVQTKDEIGKLAQTFDYMTATLAQRNQELTEQASKLEAVLNSIVDGVIVLDMDEQIITTNLAAEKLLADMSYDFNAGPMRELTAPGFRASSSTETPSLLSTTSSGPKRYQVGNRILSTLAAPVTTPTGEQIGTVIVLRDITSEAEADQLKDAFITSISHELRTPLTVIKVYTDLMQRTANGNLDERHIGFLDKISKNSLHLEQHINQLINISEIQAGTFNIEKQKVDFVSLVQKVAEIWKERITSKGLTFEVDLPDEPVWIDADPNQLNWAIEVLLSNAQNYTQTGGIVVHLFVENSEARLAVIDTGIGIASADQPHLFDRFFRASNAMNYNVRGVGLGLYIARSIVELLDGRIQLESESGKGSIFTITLPLYELAHEPA
ncbi:MAG: HAMP domain-containing protein [Ardenticatenaceae bacterium]|nr:HAMP domain-containing protein [Ardenticatenaceae bacterium]MCB9445319.1 HAMP domain-containing protein [Ardenticatenaceae bacterium]